MPAGKDDMRIFGRLLPFCLAVALLPGFFMAGYAMCAEAMRQVPYSACATVTFVKGIPMLAESESPPQAVTAGQTLYAGSKVQTDSVSRVELTFAGGGIVRLAGETTLELGIEVTDAPSSGDRFQAMLLEGDIWANFSNQHGENNVRILATDAMFSGPESVFRVVIFKEGIAAKVYAGQVTASGPFEITKESGRYEFGVINGGEEGAPESWGYQITPYYKMIVLASGEAHPPFRFAAKSDLTDWVRWNQQRDEGVR